MDIKQEILNLYNRGIILWEQDNQLRYKSNKRKLSQEEHAFLKENKQAIRDVFNQVGSATFRIVQSEQKESAYPLTDIQMAYLLGRGEHFKYGGVSSHVYFEVKFPKLEKSKVEKVWNMLIARHDNLRLIIDDNQQQHVLTTVPAVDIIWNENESGKEHSDSVSNIRNTLSDKYYNIGQWPMFDIGVSQLNEESLLHLSFDFLILDWTSIWILLKEFEDIYFGKYETLTPLSYSFKEYLFEKRQEKKCSDYIVDALYWKENILNYSEPPLLPFNLENIENRFERLSFCVAPDGLSRIKKISAKHGITLTNTLLTAFSVCIEPWCEKPDFVLNLTTMNREGNHRELGNIIGDFTSISPLNVKIDRTGHFLSNAVHVQKTLSNNMAHRLFSGVDVLREIKKNSQESDYFLPIVFTSSVGTVNAHYDYLKLGHYGISQTPQVFLDCQVMEINDSLQINWDVRKGVFSEYMIVNMLDKFKTYLEDLSQCDDWSKIYHIQPLVKKERIERTIVNQTEEVFTLRPLHEEIFKNIKAFSNKTALIKAGRKTSYQALGKKVNSITAQLNNLGVCQQETVGIMMAHGDTEVATILALLNIGGVYVPIDKDFPKTRINDIVQQSNMQWILTDQPYQKEALFAKMVLVDTTTISEEVAYREVDVDQPAYIIFTSGTTGMPKGVEITHSAACNTIHSINTMFLTKEENVILGVSKLNFDLSVFDIFGILSKGGTLVYPDDDDKLNPEHWAELIEEYNINIWNSAPALMQLLMQFLSSTKKAYSIPFDLALLSGDWVSVTLPDTIRHYAPACNVVALGGATEASIWSIYHICKEGEVNFKSIPYGRPLPNQTFFVLDSAMRDKPVFAQGELYIGGIGLATGYVSDKEKTNHSFIIHPFTKERIYRTGDYGRYLPGGEIEFLGRQDNQVKVNGFRIELEEIEAGLEKNPKIENACVIYNKDQEDAHLIAYVIPKKLKESQSVGVEGIIKAIDTRRTTILNHNSQSEMLLNDYILSCIQCISNENANKALNVLTIGDYDGVLSQYILSYLSEQSGDYAYCVAGLDSDFTMVKDKLASYVNVNYRQCDLNKDLVKQGFTSHDFDVVIALDMFEASKEMTSTLAFLKALLDINSWLLFTTTKNKEGEDVKTDALDATLDILEDSPLLVAELPCDKHVFTKALNIQYEDISVQTIRESLKQYVPPYMIPHHFKVLPYFPLTANGKVDRKTLTAYSTLIKDTSREDHLDYTLSGESPLLIALSDIVHSILDVPVNPKCSLYEYGADSLLMAQISGKIKTYLHAEMDITHISFDMILGHLIQSPSIKELECFIKENLEEGSETTSTSCESSNDDVGEIRYFGGEGEPLRVLFHAGFGTLNIMKDIANHMVEQEGGTVVGIEIKNNDSYINIAPDMLITTISHMYANLILEVYHPAQVQLIGYCMGGLIAVETASGLVNLGVDVMDVCLIDSHPVHVMIKDSLITESAFLSNYGVSLEKVYPAIDDRTLVHQIKKVLENSSGDIAVDTLIKQIAIEPSIDLDFKKAISKLSDMPQETRLKTYAEVIFNKEEIALNTNGFSTAYHTYIASWEGAMMTPMPYFGNVRFFGAKEQMPFLFSDIDHTLEFWREVCVGDFKVESIEGNHITCVKDRKNASDMALKIAF